jgi:uncharacterized membrane protein YeaQ/YmgE (transglycosylase-associated protein family)
LWVSYVHRRFGIETEAADKTFHRKDNMTILAWIIVGLIAGALAKMVVPGEGPGGIIGDMIVGIVGAFIGGWVFNYFGHTATTGINIYSIVVAFIGAVILLFLLRAIGGRRSTA